MKILLIVGFLSSMLFGQVLYEEYFTGGAMQLDWYPWVADSMKVIDDPTTPGGDSWAGSVANDSAPIAAAYAGAADLTDYSVESYIYTIVSSGTTIGPYNGICIRMDTVALALYSLVSDFDDDARLRLRLIVGATPTVIRDWSAGEIPGGVPPSSSWHSFKLAMSGDSIWAYYDGVLLPDCPFTDATVSQGYFGIYVFGVMGPAATKCDNIVAVDVTGIAEDSDECVSNFLAYPNPFVNRLDIRYEVADKSKIRKCRIYDVSGRAIREFTSGIGYLSSVISWDGRDEKGVAVAPGVYFISSENTLLKVVKLR